MKFLSDHFDLKQIHECLSGGDLKHTEILKLISNRNYYHGEDLMFNPIIPLSNDVNMQCDEPRNEDMCVENSPESVKNELKSPNEFLGKNFSQPNEGGLENEPRPEDRPDSKNPKSSNLGNTRKRK